MMPSSRRRTGGSGSAVELQDGQTTFASIERTGSYNISIYTVFSVIAERLDEYDDAREYCNQSLSVRYDIGDHSREARNFDSPR